MRALMKLPPELSGVAESVTKAIRQVELLGEWPAGETFAEAKQPKAIAKGLIGAVHTHLANAHIAYLYREEMQRRTRLLLGKASKAATLAFLTGHHFVIQFNWTTWGQLTPLQRIALVDHELKSLRPDGRWRVAAHSA